MNELEHAETLKSHKYNIENLGEHTLNLLFLIDLTYQRFEKSYI